VNIGGLDNYFLGLGMTYFGAFLGVWGIVIGWRTDKLAKRIALVFEPLSVMLGAFGIWLSGGATWWPFGLPDVILGLLVFCLAFLRTRDHL
jgi:hypothetical protein